MKYPKYWKAHIQPNEIGKLQRAHRVIRAQLHPCVNVLFGCHSGVQCPKSLIDHRHEDAVHNESWVILRAYNGLPKSAKFSNHQAISRVTSLVTSTLQIRQSCDFRLAQAAVNIQDRQVLWEPETGTCCFKTCEIHFVCKVVGVTQSCGYERFLLKGKPLLCYLYNCQKSRLSKYCP
jgi:hypothetical protein